MMDSNRLQYKTMAGFADLLWWSSVAWLVYLGGWWILAPLLLLVAAHILRRDLDDAWETFQRDRDKHARDRLLVKTLSKVPTAEEFTNWFKRTMTPKDN